jgi:hypothetical protein
MSWAFLLLLLHAPIFPQFYSLPFPLLRYCLSSSKISSEDWSLKAQYLLEPRQIPGISKVIVGSRAVLSLTLLKKKSSREETEGCLK